MRRLNLWALLALGIGCLAAGPTKAHTQTGITGLANELEQRREQFNIPGLALTLVVDGKTSTCLVMGVRDRTTRKPVTTETVFRIGSITKAFTSLAMLQLHGKGKLDLNRPIRDYTPDAPITNRWDETHPIRLAHVLEHTAGLLDLTRAEFDDNSAKPLTLQQGLFFNHTPRKTYWPPGLHSSYSNAGAGYAAFVLESVTGQRYEDYVDKNLFKPLHLSTARFFLDDFVKQHLATGYDSDGKTVIPYWHQILRPFGAINIAPCEMANFVKLLLNNGRVAGKQIVSARAIQRMEQPETTLAAQQGLRFGYGLGNYQYVHKGFLFHGHGGDGDGYLAHFGYNRDVNAGYFLVINAFNSHALATLRELIEDFLVAGHTPPPPPDEYQLSADAAQRLTGHYQATTFRFPWQNDAERENDRLTVELENGRLFTRFPNHSRRRLVPVSTKLFRRETDPVATAAFVEYDDELFLQGGFGNYRRIRPFSTSK